MKLSTRRDVEVPIEQVFAGITNFNHFEKRALRRGAQVERTDPATGPGLGSTWEMSFNYRGRQRNVVAEVMRFEAPDTLDIASKTGGLDARFEIMLVQLSPRKTRMIVGIDMVPSTLSARLFVQSLKLAKSAITKRFKRAVDDFASELERTHKGIKPGMTLG